MANDPYVAAVDLEEGSFLVAGLSLPGLTAAGGNAGDGHTPSEATVIDLLRRACRSAGCNVVLRATAEHETVVFSLFFCRHGQHSDASDLAALASAAARRLDQFAAVPMDGEDLDRSLAIDPGWQGARLVKSSGCHHERDIDVTILIGVNRHSSGWRGLADVNRFVLDLGLFPLSATANETALRDDVAAARAKSKVLAGYSREREPLLENAAAAARAIDEQLFVGAALTLLAPDAIDHAAVLRPFRDPLMGAVGGKIAFTVSPGEMDGGVLPFFVLDYSEESGEPCCLEADPAAFLALPSWLALGRAQRRHDPWQLLLARIETSEQQSGVSLSELRDAVTSAKANLQNGLTQARRILETIAAQQYKKCLPGGRKEILCDRIEELREKGKIPSLVASHMHTVRVHGNVGSHVTEQQANIEHLFLVVDALCLLIPWHRKQAV